MRIYDAKIQYHLVQEGPQEVLSNAEKIVQYMAGAFDEAPVAEMFYVVCLNRKNRPLGRHRVTIGTATAALAHPREVFRAAILANACAIVCVHNHPSGVILRGKRIRICRIRPQRGRFGEFIREWRSLRIGDRRIGRKMNKWEGCRGGAEGPSPLVTWGERTWPTANTGRLKFSRPIRWSPGDFHSNMNWHRRGRPAADTIIPCFCPARFPDFVTPAMVCSLRCAPPSRPAAFPFARSIGSVLSGLGRGRRACTGQRAWRTSRTRQ